MSESHFTSTVVVLVVVPLVLSALYMASYYVLLKSGKRSQDSRGVLIIVPDYRIDNLLVERLLFPAHAVDRQIRPNYWNAVNWVVGTAATPPASV